jgi:hypothetical protein
LLLFAKRAAAAATPHATNALAIARTPSSGMGSRAAVTQCGLAQSPIRTSVWIW